MNNIETIDGITGEWRTVTKASEVMVGQRVRYESGYKSRFGYKIPHFITGIKNNKVGTKGDGWDRNIFNGYWTTVQAFFPLADKPMRKVALRQSKHERLLKAILASDRLCGKIHAEIGESITQRQFDEMSKIKEAMEKKGVRV